MDIPTIRGRIVAILEAATTCAGATGGVPRSLAAADLPHFIVLVGPATRRWVASDLIEETRAWRLILLAKPWVQGIDLEAETICEPFFESVPDAFDARPALQLADNTTPVPHVQTSVQSAGEGVIGVELAGVAYSGAEWRLDVTTLERKARGL